MSTFPAMPSALPSKPCATCGRPFSWRRRWRDTWDAVRHCSDACRSGRRAGLVAAGSDPALEAAILELLAARPRRATICPSEAARRVDPAGWRALLGATRDAARRLVARGLIEITQRGHVVDPGAARGPIRLRLRTSE